MSKDNTKGSGGRLEELPLISRIATTAKDEEELTRRLAGDDVYQEYLMWARLSIGAGPTLAEPEQDILDLLDNINGRPNKYDSPRYRLAREVGYYRRSIQKIVKTAVIMPPGLEEMDWVFHSLDWSEAMSRGEEAERGTMRIELLEAEIVFFGDMRIRGELRLDSGVEFRVLQLGSKAAQDTVEVSIGDQKGISSLPLRRLRQAIWGGQHIEESGVETTSIDDSPFTIEQLSTFAMGVQEGYRVLTKLSTPELKRRCD